MQKLEPIFRTAGFISASIQSQRRRRVLSTGNGQSIRGRYNKRVNVPRTPEPLGWQNRTSWRTMDKRDKRAAKDATRYLKMLIDDVSSGMGSNVFVTLMPCAVKSTDTMCVMI